MEKQTMQMALFSVLVLVVYLWSVSIVSFYFTFGLAYGGASLYYEQAIDGYSSLFYSLKPLVSLGSASTLFAVALFLPIVVFPMLAFFNRMRLLALVLLFLPYFCLSGSIAQIFAFSGIAAFFAFGSLLVLGLLFFHSFGAFLYAISIFSTSFNISIPVWLVRGCLVALLMIYLVSHPFVIFPIDTIALPSIIFSIVLALRVAPLSNNFSLFAVMCFCSIPFILVFYPIASLDAASRAASAVFFIAPVVSAKFRSLKRDIVFFLASCCFALLFAGLPMLGIILF